MMVNAFFHHQGTLQFAEPLASPQGSPLLLTVSLRMKSHWGDQEDWQGSPPFRWALGEGQQCSLMVWGTTDRFRPQGCSSSSVRPSERPELSGPQGPHLEGGSQATPVPHKAAWGVQSPCMGAPDSPSIPSLLASR